MISGNRYMISYNLQMCHQTISTREISLMDSYSAHALEKWLNPPDSLQSRMASSLEEAKAELGIDGESVDRIRKAALRRKLVIRALNLSTPLLSFIGGYIVGGGFTGQSEPVSGGYPYAAAASPILSYRSLSKKTRVTVLGTIVASAIAFVVGLAIGGAAFERDPIVIMYGVFRTGE